MLIGERIVEYIKLLNVVIKRPKIDSAGTEDEQNAYYRKLMIKAVVPALLTFLFAGFSLYTLFINSAPNLTQEKAAYFLLGLITSYWLAPDSVKT